MGTLQLLCALFFTVFINFDRCYCRDIPKEPRIVIVGAGSAGLAAAAKLIENGFKNVTILEAENRIGGRVYTTKLGEYNVDLGAQWVHGEGENAVFKLAYPLGLLDKEDNPSPDVTMSPYVDSKGKYLEKSTHEILTAFYKEFISDVEFNDDTPFKSIGEYAEKMYDNKFSNNPQFMREKKNYLHLFKLLTIGPESAPDWYNISAPLSKRFKHYEGDFIINWKTRGYSTILDILLKRYPDPQKKLPVLEKTLLNTEVISIDYLNNTQGPPILITSANGQLFKADHAIVAVPLGVLKEKHKSLFIPPLPEKKVQAIEGIGFGNVGKVYLLFDKPFWNLGNNRLLSFNFLWNDDDRKEIESDPEKAWTLGITFVVTVNHKPNLLEYWISGDYAKAMEELPEDKVFNHSVEHLHRFLGKVYNLTTPIGMLRTRWYSNPHFRGTYCYSDVETAKRNVRAEMLEEPIDLDNLTLLFAGEATHGDRFSTVDGAIESGWKAANRLIDYYDNVLKNDIFCEDIPKKPIIVIIGAGPAGIAAASKLLENGFKNVTILEAEDRIGGRVYTTKLGDYNVDLGGQWVHGEDGNTVFKLAYPLGLLDKSDDPLKDLLVQYVDSKGNILQEDIRKNLMKHFYEDIHNAPFDQKIAYTSRGEYAEKIFNERFKDIPQFIENKKKYLHIVEMLSIGSESAATWYDVPTLADSSYKVYEGDFLTNWKTRGYSTILEILMKRYPDPPKELPVMNQTLLNTEVISINYSNKANDLPITITTASGQLFKADHVIVSVSLGVLKEKHKSLFVPPLPEKKQQAIEGIGFGNVGKIFLLFDKPFWNLGDQRILTINFMWNDDDRKAIESDSEKAWLIGLTSGSTVNHKPNLLQFWIFGHYSKAMEELPEEKVFNHTVESLHRFLGKMYNVSTPIGMLRSRWYSNPHFKGTYSFRSIETVKRNLSAEMLEEPINTDNLTLLFAGEATNGERFATVDGAVESGWKAADRLIDYYDNVLKNNL